MEETQPRTILFFGPQGAGKGTQKEAISAWLTASTSQSVLPVELGDFFRSMMKTEGHTQSLVKNIQNTGQLQPDFLAVYAITDKLISSYTGKEHLMLDGFPRNQLQVDIFQQLVEFYGLSVDVVALELSEEESVARLMKRGREDDTEAAIAERLRLYHAETEPLLDHFEAAPEYRVHRINGEQTIAEVTDAITTSLSQVHHG